MANNKVVEYLSYSKFKEIKNRFDSISDKAKTTYTVANTDDVLQMTCTSNINGGIDLIDMQIVKLSSFIQGALGLDIITNNINKNKEKEYGN